MINLSVFRGKYILKPDIPVGTEEITYEVTINSTLIFVGKSRYFGGTYEVDCSDFIETYLRKGRQTVSLNVRFIYDGGTSQTLSLSWSPDYINLPAIDTTDTTESSYAYIELSNSGFLIGDSTTNYPVRIPLDIKNGVLSGKTINRLDKTTYIDRYADIHNGGMTNHYELECYIDPCWLEVTTGNDLEYEKLMMAMQNADSSILNVKGYKISGMNPFIATQMPGRVKDVEKIETYSSYSTNKKVPSYKITFAIYK